MTHAQFVNQKDEHRLSEELIHLAATRPVSALCAHLLREAFEQPVCWHARYDFHPDWKPASGEEFMEADGEDSGHQSQSLPVQDHATTSVVVYKHRSHCATSSKVKANVDAGHSGQDPRARAVIVDGEGGRP